jgi:bacterioferritin-associated ferredoxin
LVYVCICARVRECEIREVILRGARSEEAVGEACGAGTGCGTCLDRIDELIGDQAAGDPLDAIAA